MKKSRFTDEQIIGMIKEQVSGIATAQVCRKHGISTPSFYKYNAKFGGMDVSDASKLKALEEENAKLKKLLAEQMLERDFGPPLMEWMAPASGIAMCHIGCRLKRSNKGSHP